MHDSSYDQSIFVANKSNTTNMSTTNDSTEVQVTANDSKNDADSEINVALLSATNEKVTSVTVDNIIRDSEDDSNEEKALINTNQHDHESDMKKSDNMQDKNVTYKITENLMHVAILKQNLAAMKSLRVAGVDINVMWQENDNKYSWIHVLIW